ncbi:hypothetical protein [Neokomagataea anthophila]|uniref:DUF1376 domain-containing protein n=1 Tax=Neokomagataea anthophila TaxID=2826925 RepID=A0ABS5E970_9PROT|nr:hypothetical protein [Neokomagataea anthophila]MBR0560063.1 hypothetical protein [Neokomagataea anthophila]
MLAEYAEMLLRREVPASAYCLDALSVVTEQSDWWPPVGSLARMLEEFALVQRVRRSNANQPLQISGSTTQARKLSETDKNWLRSWHQNEQLNWNLPDENGATDEQRSERRKIWTSMLRRYSPTVHEMVTGVDPGSRDPRDWQDADRLRHTLRRISEGPFQPSFFRCVQAAVGKHAPDNMGLVIEAMQAANVPLSEQRSQ